MTTQLLDYRLEIDENNAKAECYFPGVAYDDFDRAGNLSPWKVCRMLEAGRAIPFRQADFLHVTTLRYGDSFTYFVIGGNYFFNPCLWEVVCTHKYFPYKITTELISIGRTSFTMREVLTNLIDNVELASVIMKLVYIDNKSRLPQAIPSWLCSKYQRLQSQDGLKFASSVTKIPDNAYSNNFVAAASDTDHNGHTNQASYIRFCFNTAELARRVKHLQHFTRDICLYPIIKMSVAYKGETLCGDELTASVWESDLELSSLHFSISKGNTVVFVATVSFKGSPSAKL